MKKLFAFVFLHLIATVVLADSIEPVLPPNGATVSMLTPEQQLFCHLKEAEGRKVLADLNLREFFAASVKSFPKGIELAWVFSGMQTQVQFELLLADNEEFENARTFLLDQSNLKLYNLFNGKTYYWKVAAICMDGPLR